MRQGETSFRYSQAKIWTHMLEVIDQPCYQFGHTNGPNWRWITNYEFLIELCMTIIIYATNDLYLAFINYNEIELYKAQINYFVD